MAWKISRFACNAAYLNKVVNNFAGKAVCGAGWCIDRDASVLLSISSGKSASASCSSKISLNCTASPGAFKCTSHPLLLSLSSPPCPNEDEGTPKQCICNQSNASFTLPLLQNANKTPWCVVTSGITLSATIDCTISNAASGSPPSAAQCTKTLYAPRPGYL